MLSSVIVIFTSVAGLLRLVWTHIKSSSDYLTKLNPNVANDMALKWKTCERESQRKALYWMNTWASCFCVVWAAVGTVISETSSWSLTTKANNFQPIYTGGSFFGQVWFLFLLHCVFGLICLCWAAGAKVILYYLFMCPIVPAQLRKCSFWLMS